MCEFLVHDKYCIHPEAAYFTDVEILNEVIERHDAEVSTKTAEIKFKCKGKDKCEVYKELLLLRQSERKSEK